MSSPLKPAKFPVIISWLLFLAWAVIVLWASLDARPFRPLVRLVSWDKLQHAGAYALLTLFGGLALRTLMRERPLRAWGMALTFSVCYGGAVELAQHFMTTNRHGDPLDLLADLVGGLAVFLLVLPLELRRRRP